MGVLSQIMSQTPFMEPQSRTSPMLSRLRPWLARLEDINTSIQTTTTSSQELSSTQCLMMTCALRSLRLSLEVLDRSDVTFKRGCSHISTRYPQIMVRVSPRPLVSQLRDQDSEQQANINLFQVRRATSIVTIET